MIKAIIYQSNTGFARQYAYHFAIKVGVPIYSIDEAKKLLDGINVIYFSWIKNGKIVDLDKVKRFNISYVCSVGLLDYTPEYIESLKKDNNIDNIYYLKGGLRLYKLNNKKKKEKLSDSEKELLYKLEKGYETIDLDSLNALIDWCINENNNIVS